MSDKLSKEKLLNRLQQWKEKTQKRIQFIWWDIDEQAYQQIVGKIKKLEIDEGLVELIIDALQIEGGHHKQWFLERIVEKLGLNIEELRDKYDLEKGIAP